MCRAVNAVDSSTAEHKSRSRTRSEAKRSDLDLYTYAPYSSQMFSASLLENGDLKSMSNTVRGRRYSSQTSTNDGDLRAAQAGMRWRRGGGEYFVQDPLDDLVDPKERTESHSDMISGTRRIYKQGKGGGGWFNFSVAQ